MRKQKILSLVLILMVLISALGTVAFAGNSNEKVAINLTTDKKEYNQGEDVNIEITIKNTSGKDLKQVEVKNTLPKGLEVKSNHNGEKLNKNTVKWNLDELKKDDTVNLKLSSTFNEYKEVVTVPNTGTDNYNYLLLGFILFIVGCLVITYLKKKSTKFDKNKTISVGMALVIMLGALSQSFIIADASSSLKKLNISKVLKLKCDGKELDNILEVKGIFIENIDTPNEPGDTETPDEPGDIETPGKPGDIETPDKPGDTETQDSDLMDPDNPKWNMDTDNDGLKDAEEELIGTNPNNPDTDGDGLNDKFEVEAGLDPTKKDSDGNGKLDPDEDLDGDLLTNIEEQYYKTNPLFEDTDGDGLTDGDEINKYKTNPLVIDTDKDGLNDNNEIELGTDPNNKDTNGNGILDGNEKYQVDIETRASEKDENIELLVSGNIKGEYIDDIYTTNMENTHEFFSKDMPGYIGAPFRVGVDVDGLTQELELTFKVNQKNLKGRSIEDIGLYEYDKEDNSIKLVTKNITRSKSNEIKAKVLIEDFKEYIILISDEWNGAWQKELLDPENKFNELDIALTIDSSGSMVWNDPNDLRKEQTKVFVDKLEGGSRASIIDFDEWSYIVQELTTDKAKLKSAIDKVDSMGGTDISLGLKYAISSLTSSSNVLNLDEQTVDDKSNRLRCIMLLTDGESYVSKDDPSIIYAKNNGIKIFTVGLGNQVEEDTLRMIAKETGGTYLHAKSADDLADLFNELTNQTIDLVTDTDGDGIPNYFERNLRLPDGEIISLDPNNPDTDGDGLSDGFEITGKDNPTVQDFYKVYNKNKKYFNYVSRPDKKDTDNDRTPDGNGGNVNNGSSNNIVDKNPTKYEVSDRMLLESADLSYTEEKIWLFNKDKKVKDISYKFKEDSGITTSTSKIGDWSIVKHNSGGLAFGAIALKKDDKMIVSYTGTGTGIGSAYEFTDTGYDVLADLSILFKSCSQNNNAEKFMKNVIKQNKDVKEIYISGHSLGGHLTQFTANDLYSDIKYKNKLKKAVTFNAAPFTNPVHIDGKGGIALTDSIHTKFLKEVIFNLKSIDERIDMIINHITKNGHVIKYNDSKWEAYDNKELDNVISNYVIQNDFLNYILGGRYLGADINILDKDKPRYKPKDMFKAHALNNFYSHIKQ